jgi:hypothetical protein
MKKKKAIKGGRASARKTRKTKVVKRAAKKARKAARPRAKAKAAARKPSARAKSSKPARKSAAPVRAAAPGPIYGEGDWKADEEYRETPYESSESHDAEALAREAAEDLEPDLLDSEDEEIADSAGAAAEEEPEW